MEINGKIVILYEKDIVNESIMNDLLELINEGFSNTFEINIKRSINEVTQVELNTEFIIQIFSAKFVFKSKIKDYLGPIHYILVDPENQIIESNNQLNLTKITRENELKPLIERLLTKQHYLKCREINVPSHVINCSRSQVFEIFRFNSYFDKFNVYHQNNTLEPNYSTLIEEYLSIFKINYNSEFLWEFHIKNIVKSIDQELFESIESKKMWISQLQIKKDFKQINQFILNFFIKNMLFREKLNEYLWKLNKNKLSQSKYIYHSLISNFICRYNEKSKHFKAYYILNDLDIESLKIGNVVQVKEFILAITEACDSKFVLELNFDYYQGKELFFNHIDIGNNQILVLPYTHFTIVEISNINDGYIIRLLQNSKNNIFMYNNYHIFDILSNFIFKGDLLRITNGLINSSINYLIMFKTIFTSIKQSICIELHDLLSVFYLVTKQYVKSIHYADSAAKLISEQSSHYYDLALIYYRLSLIYSLTSDINNTNLYLHKSLEILERLPFSLENELLKSYILNEMCSIYIDLSNLEKASEYIEKAIRIRKIIIGETNMLISISYNVKGNLMRQCSCYQESLSLYSLSLKIQKTLYPEPNLFNCSVLGNLSNIHGLLNQYELSIQYCLRSLDIFLEIAGEEYLLTAKCYNNLGIIYHDLMQLKKAKSLYEKSLRIRRIFLPETNIEVAASYNNLAIIYRELFDYKTSLDYYTKSLNIRLEILGEYNLDTAQSYNNLGTLYKFLNNKMKAIEYYKKSLEIRLKLFGEQSLHVATSYYNFGSLYEDNNENLKAIEYFMKSLEIRKKIFGIGNYTVCLTYFNIGKNYECINKWKQAYDNYKLSLEHLFQCENDSYILMKTIKNKLKFTEEKLKFLQNSM